MELRWWAQCGSNTCLSSMENTQTPWLALLLVCWYDPPMKGHGRKRGLGVPGIAPLASNGCPEKWIGYFDCQSSERDGVRTRELLELNVIFQITDQQLMFRWQDKIIYFPFSPWTYWSPPPLSEWRSHFMNILIYNNQIVYIIRCMSKHHMLVW